jgi:hypothetical protein
MIYYIGDTHLVLEDTFEDMIMGEIHDTPLVGLSGEFYEHEVAHMVELLYMKVSRLQVLLDYIIKSRGDRFHCVVWKEHDMLACMELIPSIWCPSVDCI